MQTKSKSKKANEIDRLYNELAICDDSHKANMLLRKISQLENSKESKKI